MSWVEGFRARLGLLFGGRAAESRAQEEFRFHIEMETDRLVRENGYAPDEARRRALAAFGGVQNHRESMRDGRGPAWLTGLSLDFKLGFRMLVKYPGLTIVGGLAMAFAIWVGVVVFEMLMLFVSPSLPLPDGDRIVHLRNYDVEMSDEVPGDLYDYGVWREAMRSVTDFGAWQDVGPNLTGRDGEARPLMVAAITASGFRVAGTPPLLGRALVQADEELGAPTALVLGHETWRTRFGGDSAVVGRSVRLDDAFATVVGVMPEGFRFPMAHDAWIPFRPNVIADAPGRGPEITIFGRLAPEATIEGAQVELTALGLRAARDFPETREHLRPQVMPYAKMIGSPTEAEGGVAIFALVQAFSLMLLMLVCGNVALLLFARAATRENEIIVRSALGASRGRIIMQLFAEALVLGGVAAVVGLVAAREALHRVGLPFLQANIDNLPFWLVPRLSPGTVLYACGLTLLAAAVVGVVPGLKVTRGIGSRMRAGAADSGTLRFGGVWTAVIVAQVAVTVAFPAIALLEAKEIRHVRSYDVGFADDEYLAVQLGREAAPGVDMENDTAAAAAHRAQFGLRVEALRQRLAAEPGVVGVTFADRLPRLNYGGNFVSLDDSVAIAAAGAAMGTTPKQYTKIAYVDPSYFDVLGAPVLAGRGFQAADLAPGVHVAVVDRGFVDQMLLGLNPIGRRVRIFGDGPVTGPEADALPWYEIVGVVPDLGMIGASEKGFARGLYLPAAPGTGFSPQMLIHARGDPMALVPSVRAIAATVDPALRLSEIQRLDQVADDLLWLFGMWLRITLGLTAVALLVSLAGIYAVLSFTVARRTREIGVRVALGANPRRVVTAIFRRPLTQVATGIVFGAILIALGAQLLSHTTEYMNTDIALSAGQMVLLALYAVFMLGVCLIACVVPTRRALGVEPMVAMRVE